MEPCRHVLIDRTRIGITAAISLLVLLSIPHLHLRAQNVGIGTNAPAQKLDVQGFVELGDESFTDPGTAGAIRYNSTVPTIEFHDGTAWQTLGGMDNDWSGAGTGNMFATNTGDDVGIGTNAPAHRLHVVAAANEEAGFIHNAQSGTQTVEAQASLAKVDAAGGKADGVFGRALSDGTGGSDFGGIFGVKGQARHPAGPGGTVDLTGGRANKFLGIGGIFNGGGTPTVNLDEGDAMAAVYGTTGMHNSSGNSVGGGGRLYAGLFQGNGRVLGLRGENSAFIEILPEWQQDNFFEGVLGYYNSDPSGGNNGGSGSAASADDFFSIEANIQDGGQDLVLQDRNASGNVGIGTNNPTEKLEVNGNIFATGTITSSDRRFKQNIAPVGSALASIQQLRGVTYEWNREDNPGRNFRGETQIGFIAQEVESVLPELVVTDNDGYKGILYGQFAPVFVEAIKEQQAQIDALKTEKQALRRQLDQQDQRIQRLEEIIRRELQQ